jgi:hypothetical protein
MCNHCWRGQDPADHASRGFRHGEEGFLPWDTKGDGLGWLDRLEIDAGRGGGAANGVA